MQQSVMEDPFDVLDVPVNASDERIKAAHRAKIRRCHPDVGGKAEDAARLNWARDMLLDPVTRFDYLTRRAERIMNENGQSTGHQQQDFSNGAGPDAQRDDPEPDREQPKASTFGQARYQTAQDPGGRSPVAWWVISIVAAALSLSCVQMAVAAWRSAFVLPHEWGAFVLVTLGWAVLAKAWWLSGSPRRTGERPRGLAARVLLAFVMLFAASSILIAAQQSPYARPLTPDSVRPTTGQSTQSTSAVPGTVMAAGECRGRDGGSAPDAACSPGVTVKDASRTRVCEGTLGQDRPDKSAARAAKQTVTAAYTDAGTSTGKASLAFVVPPKLGGAWHLQNLWFGNSTATPEVVAGITGLLCQKDSPVTYRQVLKAAQSNRLDTLLRNNT